MNDKCFEIGTMQAFLDGETSPELSFSLTSHAAACDKCALALAQAEEENAQLFAMLDRELNSLVPTQRLWSSITVALSEEKKQASFWERVRGGILAMFANPSMAVAASVLLIFGIFAGVWTLRAPMGSDSGPEMASNPQVIAAPAALDKNVVAASSPTGVLQPPTKIDMKVNSTNLSADRIAKLKADYRPEVTAPRAEPAVLRGGYLPGEESYVSTIASLKQNVDGKKDFVMDPSSRVSYERDIAVVNDTIKKMKDVVRKNPKNQAAKQVLYSSYQNKIDLLNSVVEREELLASLR